MLLRNGKQLLVRTAKWGYVLLLALGVPIPVIFLIFLLRGCQ
jgi:hypothetical protein